MNSLSSVVADTVLWALLSTLWVGLLGIPLAYALARFSFWGKHAVSTLVSLPLVLPPTAVGYLLLLMLADNGPLGRDRLGFDLDVLFNWKGIVLACGVMSMPLVVRTARVSFEEVNPRLEMMARTLGYGPLRTFFKVTVPLASRGLGAALVLGFVRAIGEFGATMMVAGNIPGKTQTLSLSIYSAQQAGHDERAYVLLWVALLVGFAAIFLTEWLARPRKLKRRKEGA